MKKHFQSNLKFFLLFIVFTACSSPAFYRRPTLARLFSLCSMDFSYQTVESVIETTTGVLIIPEAELRRAMQQPDKYGLSASYFRHPAYGDKAGRLMVTFGNGIPAQSAALKEDCPNLYALVEAYKAHCSSAVLMLTWAGGLLLHVDQRAIESVAARGWSAKRAKSVASPRDSILTLQTVSGEATKLQYAGVGHLDTATKALLAPKQETQKFDCVTILREAGMLQAMPSWLHAGHAIAKRGEGGAMLVKQRETVGEIGPTLFHAAGANGKRATVSMLATCDDTAAVVRLRAELRLLEAERLKRVERSASFERRSLRQPEASAADEWLEWDAPFHSSLTESFPLSSNSDGTGGQGAEKHGEKIKAGMQKAMAAGVNVGKPEAGMRDGETILREPTASENEVISKYIEAPPPCLRLAASTLRLPARIPACPRSLQMRKAKEPCKETVHGWKLEVYAVQRKGKPASPNKQAR